MESQKSRPQRTETEETLTEETEKPKSGPESYQRTETEETLTGEKEKPKKDRRFSKRFSKLIPVKGSSTSLSLGTGEAVVTSPSVSDDPLTLPPPSLSMGSAVLDNAGIVLNVVSNVVKYTPAPYVGAISAVASSIIDLVNTIKDNKDAFEHLAVMARRLVLAVDKTYKFLHPSTEKAPSDASSSGTEPFSSDPTLNEQVDELLSMLKKIENFVKSYSSRPLFRRVVSSKADLNIIQDYRDHLNNVLNAFMLQSNIIIQGTMHKMSSQQERMLLSQESMLLSHEHVRSSIDSLHLNLLKLGPNEQAQSIQGKNNKGELSPLPVLSTLSNIPLVAELPTDIVTSPTSIIGGSSEQVWNTSPVQSPTLALSAEIDSAADTADSVINERVWNTSPMQSPALAEIDSATNMADSAIDERVWNTSPVPALPAEIDTVVDGANSAINESSEHIGNPPQALPPPSLERSQSSPSQFQSNNPYANLRSPPLNSPSLSQFGTSTTSPFQNVFSNTSSIQGPVSINNISGDYNVISHVDNSRSENFQNVIMNDMRSMHDLNQTVFRGVGPSYSGRGSGRRGSRNSQGSWANGHVNHHWNGVYGVGNAYNGRQGVGRRSTGWSGRGLSDESRWD